MGKIKGWTLSPFKSERKKPVWYNKISKKRLLITDGLSGKYHVMYDGQTRHVTSYKERAKDYAIDYMRSHPNG